MLFHFTNSFGICLPAIAVIQCPHAPVFRIRKKDFRNPQQRTIKHLCMWTTGVFPCCETNATAIGSVLLNFVYCKVRLVNQAQTHKSADTIAHTLNEGIPASVRMCVTTASLAVRDETNKNNLHRAVQNTPQYLHIK
jgi:hypothetical protein